MSKRNYQFNPSKKSFSFARNEQWENLHSYGTQTLPLDRSSMELRRSNQAAKLFEERKRHYEAQQLNYMRYMDKQKGRKHRSTSEMNGYDTHQRPITGQNAYYDNAQYANKRIREISVPVPDPDYNVNVFRNDSFDTRPPLRSALRASRY